MLVRKVKKTIACTDNDSHRIQTHGADMTASQGVRGKTCTRTSASPPGYSPTENQRVGKELALGASCSLMQDSM